MEYTCTCISKVSQILLISHVIYYYFFPILTEFDPQLSCYVHTRASVSEQYYLVVKLIWKF